MGDASDRADVERFIRSTVGQKVLGKTRKAFQGLWISDISFAPRVEGVMGTITFHAGNPVDVLLPNLSLGRIRDAYEDVLEEEYYRDFPDRRPNADHEEEPRNEENGHGGTA